MFVSQKRKKKGERPTEENGIWLSVFHKLCSLFNSCIIICIHEYMKEELKVKRDKYFLNKISRSTAMSFIKDANHDNFILFIS